MAGDWIKMRVWLARDPRVIHMADYLANQRSFMNWLTDPVRQSCKESAYEHVTRNVIVALCVTGLLVTWGTAREKGDRIDDDLILDHCDKYTLDAITDIECFGEAMEAVGWLIENDNGSVTFPKYFKDNESPDEKHKRQAADRQARFREKKRQESNVSSSSDNNVTSNVTVTHREEKRREEVNKSTALSGKPSAVPDASPLSSTETPKNGQHYNPIAREVLGFLNTKTGRHYQPVDANLKLIVARLKEGASVADCRAVVAKKCREWAADEKMSSYLRPATLFNATKFAQYRGELLEVGTDDQVP